MIKNLLNFQSTMFEIRDILLHDETIRKLLYFDTKDAYTKTEVPSVEDLLTDGTGKDLNYITLFPIMEKGVKEYGRNTYIQITLPLTDLDVSSGNNNIFAGVLVTCITDRDHYMLNDNKLRLIEIANRALQLLDGAKCSAAGKLEVINMQEVIFDTEVYGYTLKVVTTDMGKGVDF